MENSNKKIDYTDVSVSEEKKPCKKCKSANRMGLSVTALALVCGYFMVYGFVVTIKDIISLFTH